MSCDVAADGLRVHEHPATNPHTDKLTGVKLSENCPAVHAAEQPLRVLDGQERLQSRRRGAVRWLGVTVHPSRELDDDPAGVAFDVASRHRWTGAAQQADVRSSEWIYVPELPWPLRFSFLRVEEDDGSTRLALVGFEVGAAIPRDGLESLDPAELEVTAERVAIIWANFDRYRRIAEDLHAEPWNPEKAAKTRTAMGRRAGGALTPVELALLAAEWQRRRGKPGATI